MRELHLSSGLLLNLFVFFFLGKQLTESKADTQIGGTPKETNHRQIPCANLSPELKIPKKTTTPKFPQLPEQFSSAASPFLHVLTDIGKYDYIPFSVNMQVGNGEFYDSL